MDKRCPTHKCSVCEAYWLETPETWEQVSIQYDGDCNNCEERNLIKLSNKKDDSVTLTIGGVNIVIRNNNARRIS